MQNVRFLMMRLICLLRDTVAYFHSTRNAPMLICFIGHKRDFIVTLCPISTICISDKSQLRQYLIDGYKDKLDVTLLPDWEPLHVSNIFTPAILICDRKKETQEKEKFRNLETYRELFYKNGVLQKRVVLLGEAGAGKTTFVKHVTDVWCETTMQPQFPDVDVLKKFKYLFYVSFRFAEEKETLSEMINSQLFGDETMKDVAKYVLKTYPEHCLIVLDGADEWKGSPTSETGRRGDIAGLPGLSGVDGCVILITSRPWRFHALSKKARDIFRRLEISGIKNVRELAYRILEQLADPYPVKSSYQFLRQAREKNMSELMKIPLLLIIALGGWVGDKSLHISITINYINMIQSFISRSKGQAGWSDPESKLRRLIPNLDKLETKWELESNKLPDVFLRYESIQRFAGLFLSLGELAFDLLLGKEEQSLVFSRQVLQKYPSVNYESVQVCLALGILSKTETLTCGIKKLESYAFCHKSFHEFFAALWLASTFSNQKSKLYKCIKTDRDLYSYEIMITFFCKLNPEAGKQLWLDLAQELEKEKELQNLVCKHMKKHRFDLENQSSIQVYFCVPHIVINWRTSDEDIMLLCHAMEKYPCNVKSLYVDARHSEQQASSMCRSTSSCCGLQSLKLKNLRTVSEHYLPSVNDLISPDLDLQKHNKLEILELHSLSIKGLLLPVEGARITSLTLYHVAMPHHSCEQLSESLSSCSYLVDLDLGAVRCREHRDSCCIPVLDLQKHDKLKRLELQVISIKGLLLPVEGARITSLMLYHVTMTHHSCKQLPEYLSSCSHLEDLYLNFVRCREHRYSSCIPVLDLQKHDKLETLRLLSLSIEGLLLPVEGARITSLKLKDVIMTHHGCKQLSGFFSSRPELWDPYLKVKCREHKDSPCQAIKDIRNLK